MTKKTKDKVNNKKIKKTPKKSKQEDNNELNFDNEIIIGINSNQKQNTKNKNKTQKKKVKKKYRKKKLSEKEIKRNRIIKAILKWIVLIILLIGSIIYFLLSPLFNIVEVNVENNSKISTEEIISLSKIKTGDNIFKTRKTDVINSIKEDPYIESVQVSRKLPNIINIIVKERTTNFLLEFVNAYVYLDKQGYILEISEEKLDLPIITGYKTPIEEIEPGNRLILEDLKKLEKVIEIVDVATSNDVIGYITKIDISDATNYKLILEGEGKVAYLGDTSELNVKILYMKKIIELEAGKEGEIFLNRDLNKEYVFFRESVYQR